MKASRFNRLFQASDGTWLAFNGWSTALAEIEPENVAFVQALLAHPDSTPCDTPLKREIREALVQAHFLIEDEDDELATLKADTLRERFRTDALFLTIAPTLNCNFRCDYCYEEHLKVTMSKAVQQALVGWVEERTCTASELHVTWYGGEPLLPQAYPIVESLSRSFTEIATRRGLTYGAHLVTNGYFLDRPKTQALVELGVSKVQVTLDGPPAIHDKRRVLAGGQGTFWRLIQNLKDTVDLVSIQVRINVDQRNSIAALEVAEILQREGLGEKVRPYLAQVTFDGAACGNILELCYSSEEFARTEIEIYREAARRGLPLSRYPFRLSGSFCTADRANGFVVAPSGALFKCWHEVTLHPERSIGSLLDEQQPFQKRNEDLWLSWNPYERSGCRSCDVLPMCHGGCPLEAMKDKEADHGACEHFKFHLEPLLEIRYQHPVPDGGSTPARDMGARDLGARDAGREVTC
ncbi:MAG: SPASM domain-containing protein [Planctomycetota bacterium]